MPTENTFNYIFDCVINGINQHFSDKRKADWFCDKLRVQKRAFSGTYIQLRNLDDRDVLRPQRGINVCVIGSEYIIYD
jgi:hypothetical protein